MPIQTVGIVGYGSFGEFLHRLGQRFFPDIEYRVYSRRGESDNELFFDLKTVAQSDVVIICGAISEFETQLKAVIELARPDTTIVDVATVKKHTAALCRTQCGDRPYLCVHPMFGPASYQKTQGDVTGWRIALCESTLAESTITALKTAFEQLGFFILGLSADDHDKLLAETLFLTHYIGQTIKQAGFLRTDIDTVSFQFLMNAVESVQADGRLFRDVYHYNPYCEAVAQRLHAAQAEVYQQVTKGSD